MQISISMCADTTNTIGTYIKPHKGKWKGSYKLWLSDVTSYSCCLDRFILWHFPQALLISTRVFRLNSGPKVPPSTPHSHAAALLPLFFSQFCSSLQLSVVELSEATSEVVNWFKRSIIAKLGDLPEKPIITKMSWSSTDCFPAPIAHATCCRRASSSLPESKQRDDMMILLDRSTWWYLPNLIQFKKQLNDLSWFFFPILSWWRFKKDDVYVYHHHHHQNSFVIWFTPLP